MSEENRLFVPLNTEPYRWFENGGKTWELRGINPQYNTDTVYEGRRAELRRGYNTEDSLWGTITDVKTFESLADIPFEINHEKIHPGATRTEFIDNAVDLLSDYDQYIAFRVELDE